MNWNDHFWADIIGLAIAVVLFNGALTGKFYTHGRGVRPHLIADIRSPLVRFALIVLSLALCAWLVWDLRAKIQF